MLIESDGDIVNSNVIPDKEARCGPKMSTVPTIHNEHD